MIISESGTPVIIDLEEIHCEPAILDIAKSCQHIGMSEGIDGIKKYAQICAESFRGFNLDYSLLKASCLLVNTNLYNWGYQRDCDGVGNHQFNKSVMRFMQKRFYFIKEKFRC